MSSGRRGREGEREGRNIGGGGFERFVFFLAEISFRGVGAWCDFFLKKSEGRGRGGRCVAMRCAGGGGGVFLARNLWRVGGPGAGFFQRLLNTDPKIN